MDYSNYRQETPEWLKKENWSYCCLCKQVSYKFDCCGNVTCSGGGCEKCKEKHKIIDILIAQGLCPRFKDLDKHSTKEDIDKLFGCHELQ